MKKGEHKGRPAGGDRGLYDYGSIVDTQGSTITVRTSSSAEQRAVWIFTKDRDGVLARVGPPWQPVQGEPNVQIACPHLGVREAKLLIDALERFIAGGAS